MSARTRRNLALALAIVLELVVGVGTLSVRHGRTVTSGHGPSTTAAPDTSVGGPLAVESTTTTKAASAPSGPVRVSPGPGMVKVSWDRVPGSVRLYSVEATDQATGYSGTVFACGTCTEATFQHLVDGHQYTFVVSAYKGAGPVSPRRSPVATPTSPLCPPGPCLAVDPDVSLGPATQREQGFLHGITDGTDPGRVTALHLRSWRGAGGPQQASIVGRYTKNTSQIMSDYWTTATYDLDKGGVKPPWDDWGAYEAFVSQTVQKAKGEGWAPQYWDALNEPDAGLAPYYRGTVLTLDRIFELYAHTYKAIRDGDSHARIVAPSISGFTVAYDPKNPLVFDLPRFLSYAAAHDLRFDAIGWHETFAAHLRAFDSTPEAIASHVASMRAMLTQWPSLGHPTILINEYIGSPDLDIPGWRVAYLSALEDAGAEDAGASCSPDAWGDVSGCLLGTLGGLLGKDRATPRGPYWVHLAYANMKGTRVGVSSSVPNVSGYATAKSGEPVKVLIGRHQSCVAALNKLCHEPASATPGPTPLRVVIRVGGADRTVPVTIERIPDTAEDMPNISGPLQQVPVRNGVVQVVLPSVADGDAYAVTAG